MQSCENSWCVTTEETPDGQFRFKSTLGDDRGAVVYTPEEVLQFIRAVKRGEWNDVEDRAEELFLAEEITPVYAASDEAAPAASR